MGSTVHKKQCALGELHLRKHLGTSQGPAAEEGCHWGALSHWCASVQRPCKSSTKEPRNTQGQINTTKTESCNMETLYKTQSSYVEGQFQQVQDNSKKKKTKKKNKFCSSFHQIVNHFQSKKICQFGLWNLLLSSFFLLFTMCKINKISPASKPPVLQNKCNLNKQGYTGKHTDKKKKLKH